MTNKRSEVDPSPAAGKADPEQLQRFLETARELGCEPTSEADLGRVDDVLRRMAKMPPERRGPMRKAGKPAEEPQR